jgi:glycosyltransferase involved in cell wall biosynthesis
VKNYNDLKIQKRLISEFKERWPAAFPIDIVVATYNRFLYLKKCVHSILASTQIPFRLIVGDDNSPDHIKQWLVWMRKRKKIDALILNKINVGSADNFNRLIENTNTPWFVMLGDDVWVHRGWDYACMDIILQHDDCGIVSFYDFTGIRFDVGVWKRVGDYALKGGCTGLGCSMFSKELWEKAGKFRLSSNKKMGFFTSRFCKKAFKLKNIVRNQLYTTIPHYGNNMDRRICKLEEIHETIESGYIWHRIMNKRGVSLEKAKELYYAKDKKVVLD